MTSTTTVKITYNPALRHLILDFCGETTGHWQYPDRYSAPGTEELSLHQQPTSPINLPQLMTELNQGYLAEHLVVSVSEASVITLDLGMNALSPDHRKVYAQVRRVFQESFPQINVHFVPVRPDFIDDALTVLVDVLHWCYIQASVLKETRRG